jgi:hypothetical protein
MHASSSERHKTAQRILFLLFANNNCFPMSDGKLVALFEFRRFYITDVSNRKLIINVGNDFMGSPRPLSPANECVPPPPLFLKVGGFLKLHRRSWK